MIDISIIIVNYNSGRHLENCITSIRDALLENCEIIVVDNCSNDTSLKFLSRELHKFGNLKLINNSENIGFAAANNMGVLYANGKILHFLNPDTIVNTELNKSYKAILSFSENLIFITPLIDLNGNKIKTDHVLPFLSNYVKLLLPWGVAKKWYTGASVMMSKATFDRVGGWPTDYFMYSEDLDLFYKASLTGIEVKELNTEITHAGEGTTKAIWSEIKRLTYIESSYFKFSKKYNRVFDYYVYRILCVLSLLFSDPRLAWIQLRLMYKMYSIG